MDFYQIIGVERNATQEQIKRAFRIKAKVFHPDKPTGDTKKFQDLNAAYMVIGDAEKRKQYDSKLNVNMKGPSSHTHKAKTSQAPQPPTMRPHKVFVPLGREHCKVCQGYRKVNLSGTWYQCERCNGIGLEPPKAYLHPGREYCKTCHGYRKKDMGRYWIPCERCDGIGLEPPKAYLPPGREYCKACHGYRKKDMGRYWIPCERCDGIGLEPTRRRWIA
jgi:DnaJ-class molecular chaperone